MARESSFQAAHCLVTGVALGDLRVVVAAPDALAHTLVAAPGALAQRTWVTAIRWIAEFNWRSPPPDSR